jgi:hypothetical protein
MPRTPYYVYSATGDKLEWHCALMSGCRSMNGVGDLGLIGHGHSPAAPVNQTGRHQGRPLVRS